MTAKRPEINNKCVWRVVQRPFRRSQTLVTAIEIDRTLIIFPARLSQVLILMTGWEGKIRWQAIIIKNRAASGLLPSDFSFIFCLAVD